MINFEKENIFDDRVEKIKKERLQAVFDIVAVGGPLDKYLLSQGVDPSTATVYFRGSSQTGVSMHGRPVRELSDIDLLVYANKTDGTVWRNTMGRNKAFDYSINNMPVPVEVITGYTKTGYDSDLDASYPNADFSSTIGQESTIEPEGLLVRGSEFVLEKK